MPNFLYEIFLYSIPFVTLLALAGSVTNWRVVDRDLFKANSAILGHTLFIQLWFAWVRPDDAVGQPWLLYCISLFIVAWVITRRPASFMSALMAGIIAAGIFIVGVCGLAMIWVGFSERIDWIIWWAVFIMASLNLIVLAGWSIGNFGRTIRNYTLGNRAGMSPRSRDTGSER